MPFINYGCAPIGSQVLFAPVLAGTTRAVISPRSANAASLSVASSAFSLDIRESDSMYNVFLGKLRQCTSARMTIFAHGSHTQPFHRNFIPTAGNGAPYGMCARIHGVEDRNVTITPMVHKDLAGS